MPKPIESQEKALKAFMNEKPDVEFHWDDRTGAPARIRGALMGPQTGTPEEVALKFLTAQKGLFAMAEPDKELQVKSLVTDTMGNHHVKFQQMYQGLPVFGKELIVHMDSEKSVHGMNGSFMPRIDLPPVPKVDASAAMEKALSHDPDNKKRPDTHPLLMVLIHDDKPHQVWHLTLDGTAEGLRGKELAKWEYFVDAQTGEVIWRYNNLQSHTTAVGTGQGRYSGNVNLNTVHDHTLNEYSLEDRTLASTARIFTHNDSSNSPGPVAQDADNTWNAADQQVMVDCHHYSRLVFDYYLAIYGRNSFDNAGADWHIHAHYPDPWSGNNNAYWDGQRVNICDGDGVTFNPFCTLDIIAHEWTHAVTQYTANLIYSGESGALNESISDVFAALIDGDWLQGEDNWINTIQAPAGRNLADPTNGGMYDPADPITSVINGHQPDHMNDKYTGTEDNGGVHINSGIMNKAAYLIATGGTHRNIIVGARLGRDVLGRLYYQALTSHLTASSDFAAMRQAVIDSLQDLYGTDGRFRRWHAAINNAFAAVGIGQAVQPVTDITPSNFLLLGA